MWEKQTTEANEQTERLTVRKERLNPICYFENLHLCNEMHPILTDKHCIYFLTDNCQKQSYSFLFRTSFVRINKSSQRKEQNALCEVQRVKS